MVSSNLTVSGFQRRKKRGVVPRADKGLKHNYPVKRRKRTRYRKKNYVWPQMPLTVYTDRHILIA